MKTCQCGGIRREGQRNCLSCHSANMRKWRKTHKLTPEQKKKDNCRSYAGVYKRRGLLIPEPCEKCGDENVEMHHSDYNKPLNVNWLCRVCHLELHQWGA